MKWKYEYNKIRKFRGHICRVRDPKDASITFRMDIEFKDLMGKIHRVGPLAVFGRGGKYLESKTQTFQGRFLKTKQKLNDGTVRWDTVDPSEWSVEGLDKIYLRKNAV